MNYCPRYWTVLASAPIAVRKVHTGVGMSRQHRWAFGIMVALIIAGGTPVLVVRSAPSFAQPNVDAPPVTLPPGYVGSETCKGCHDKYKKKFKEEDRDTALP